MCIPALGAIFPALGGAGAAAGAAATTAAAVGPVVGMMAPQAAALASAGAAAGTAGGLWGTLGTIAQIGAGLFGAIGQAQNARLQAEAARRSAEYAQEAARESLEAGEQESDLVRRRGAQLMGQNMVAMAANGMDVTGVQALDVLDDTRQGVEQDAFRIRTNAWREAKSLSQQSANYRAEEASARSAAFFQPLQTIMSTAATVGNRYASWQAGRMYPGTSNTIMYGGYS